MNLRSKWEAKSKMKNKNKREDGKIMYRVVVIGGGWSGIAAAVTAKKAGAEVILIEKTDLLLGLGNVGGIMRNNGRFTAAEENIAMGARELFDITDKTARHRNIDFPGHRHASLYDVIKTEPLVRRLLKEMNIEVRLISRAVDTEFEADTLKSENNENIIEKKIRVKSIELASGEKIEGDVFVECTGSTGPMGNCFAYGNGCSMCVLRCPAFGPRVSITQKIGLHDILGKRKDGKFGAFSGSGKLEKASLSEELQERLEKEGVAIVPLRKEEVNREKLDMKVCKQYALEEYAENIILLDTGYAKIMTPFYPLGKLREIPGFENARYVDPYAGGKGNSIRYLSVTERDDYMKVNQTENLFCGGEKAGFFVGHTEAISTGSPAGHNAVRFLAGKPQLKLPEEITVGDLITFVRKKLEEHNDNEGRYTFAGSTYFDRMKEKGLYSVKREEIEKRIKVHGLLGIYDEKILK